MQVSGSVSNITQIPTRSHSSLQNLTANDHPQYFTNYDTAANRPAAGNAGRLYYATNTRQFSRDNGSSWDNITPLEAFSDMSDFPGAYVSNASKLLSVNSAGNGLAWIAQGAKIVASSSVQVTNAHNTSENTLATITLPANTMGSNGVIHGVISWNAQNTGGAGGTQHMKLKFGSTTILDHTHTSTSGGGNMFTEFWISNVNATNSQLANDNQIGDNSGTVAVLGVTQNTTAAEDTTASVTILINALQSVSAHTTVLRSYAIEVIPN